MRQHMDGLVKRVGKRSSWLALVGVGLLSACGGTQNLSEGSQESQSGDMATDTAVTQDSQTQSTLPPSNDREILASLVSWSPQVNPLGLIASTPGDDRLKQVKTGRDNPFASGDTLVVNITPPLTQANPNPAVAPVAPGAPAMVPPPPTQPQSITLVPLADPSAVSVPLTAPAPAAIVPPVVAPVVAGSPTPISEGLSIQGVMQLDNQWQAIVRENATAASTTVRAGDSLAGGQVQIKQIGPSPAGVLQIVLEENGIEVVHTVS